MLNDEEAGQLFKAIFQYFSNGVELKTDNRVLAMTFAVFKAQIDRGQERYDNICKKRAEAANKKWERFKSMQMDANGCKSMQMDANDTSKGDSGSVSDSGSDSGSHSDSHIKKESKKKKVDAADAAARLGVRKEDFYNLLIPYVTQYGKEMIRAFFDYWSEPNKSKTKMRFELERTWDLSRRLSLWASRENQFSHRNDTVNRRDSQEARAKDAADIIKRLAETNKPVSS